MCCGQPWKKATPETASPVPPSPPAKNPAKAAPRPVENETPLRYLRDGQLALRGPRTGRVYHFDSQSDPTPVGATDLEALLLTRLFTIAAHPG